MRVLLPYRRALGRARILGVAAAAVLAGATLSACDDDDDTDYAAEAQGTHQGTMSVDIYYPGDDSPETLLDLNKSYTATVSSAGIDLTGEVIGHFNYTGIKIKGRGFVFNVGNPCTIYDAPCQPMYGMYKFTYDGIDAGQYCGGYIPSDDENMQFYVQAGFITFCNTTGASSTNANIAKDIAEMVFQHYGAQWPETVTFPLSQDVLGIMNQQMSVLEAIKVVFSFEIEI